MRQLGSLRVAFNFTLPSNAHWKPLIVKVNQRSWNQTASSILGVIHQAARLAFIFWLTASFFFSGNNSEEWRGVHGTELPGKWRIMLFVLELMAVNCFTVGLLDPALEIGHFCIEQRSYAQNPFSVSHLLQWALTLICFLSHPWASDENRSSETQL